MPYTSLPVHGQQMMTKIVLLFQEHLTNLLNSVFFFLFWFPESEQTEQDLAREVQRADVVCLVYVLHHHAYF